MKSVYSQLGLGLALASWGKQQLDAWQISHGNRKNQKIPAKVLTKLCAYSKVS